MRFLPLIWSNLKRKKLRALLTMLSILVAFVLYGYLSAIERALVQGVSVEGADRLFVRHRVSITQLLPESYQRRMSSVSGVDLVVHSTWFGGVYKDPKNFFGQMAVTPETYLDMYPEYLLPEEQRQAWFRTRTGAIAGRKTADKYGWKVGDRIPLQATIWRKKDGSGLWEFDLVGIYDGGEDGTDTTNFFFRYDYFDEARQFGDGLVGFYLVRVDDARRAAEVAAAIDQEFENSSTETKAETEGAFLQGWARQIGDITTIVTSIMVMAFFTILLVAGNTMAQSVRERTEELGALKAMGFTNLKVLGLVLGEACFLAALGGGTGLVLASMSIAGGDPTGGLLPMFRFPRQDVLTGVGWILLLGVLSGIFPALQAMRLQIAEALRRN